MDGPQSGIQNHIESDLYSTIVDIEQIHDSCKYYSKPSELQLKQGFSVLHVNARSLKNKMDNFQTLLTNSGVEWSVICVSETWFKNDILSYFNIDNYDLFASCREGAEGGGTAVYVDKRFNAKVRDDLDILNNENTYVEIQLKHKNIIKNTVIGAIYRSPGSSHVSFIDGIEYALQKIAEESKFSILTGDFNYDLLKESEDKKVQCFSNLMHSYGYVNVISKPTRVTCDNSSLLDNIFINNESFFKMSGIIIDDISDHFPVFVNLSVSHEKELKIPPRQVLDVNKIAELNEFIESSLVDFQSITDANTACKVLINTFSNGINKFSKTVKSCRRRTPLKPWISPSILCSINRKNHLYKKYICSRNRTKEAEYKQYRNILTNVIREAKRSYFQRAFHESKGNGKKTWKLLREALNNRKQKVQLPSSFTSEEGVSYTNKHVANGFNDFFTSVAQHLDDSMPTSNRSPMDYLLGNDYPTYEGSLHTTEIEVASIIRNLNDVGGGLDRISTKVLLATYKKCISHLTYFFNLCLQTSTFPDQLKIALIVPVYKSGEKDHFTNYRPISLLPIFSKILETILHSHIISHLDQHKILENSQFGFRKMHSTYMPVALIVEEVTKAIEENEKVLGLYLDLKKAFDTVNIDILMMKLSHFGIRGSLLSIIQSYFSNRIQVVEANGSTSYQREVKLGVPQGSILGPLFFILYINDLVNVSKQVQFLLFADDTAVIIKGKTYEDLQNKVDIFIPKLTSWFLCNRLSLNPTKTCYQVYSLFPNTQDVNISLNNEKIKRSFTVKYLGVLVDENLKWDSHISYICKKISRDIGVMGRVRSFLSSKELLLLYNTLILPHLNYCAAVWGSAYHSKLQRILILQKRAVRIIDHKPRFFHTAELFVKHNILKMPDLVTQQNIVILLAFLNNNLPSLISKLFKRKRPLNTRSSEHFVMPFSRFNFRAFSLSFTAPKAWNSIVCNIFQCLDEVPRCKATLKKHVRDKFLSTYITQR